MDEMSFSPRAFLFMTCGEGWEYGQVEGVEWYLSMYDRRCSGRLGVFCFDRIRWLYLIFPPSSSWFMLYAFEAILLRLTLSQYFIYFKTRLHLPITHLIYH